MKEHLSSPDYSLLVGHERTDKSFKSDVQLRAEYLHRTDELIHQMTHGVDVTNPETGEREHRIPDTVIFLDKSARPLAWLTRELWPRLAIDKNGETYPMPDMKFLNIDREQWIDIIDPQDNGNIDISQLDANTLRSLRSIFISPTHKQDGISESIDTIPTSLDDKTILIVDEVHSTGRTLRIAEEMVSTAFPTSRVAGMHWMAGITKKGTAIGNADLPVWYRSDSPKGRGVNNRLDNPSNEKNENITQRLGSWFLSTRFKEVDEDSLQLRKELRQLANDHTVPLRISPFRYDVSTDEGYSNYKEHTERVNYGRSFDDVQSELKQQSSKK